MVQVSSHFQSFLGLFNYPKCKDSGLPKLCFPSSLLLLHPSLFLTSSSGISPPVSMILFLIPSFPHSFTCSPHYPFWAKPYHLCPAFSLAVQEEEPDMGKIPENTLNIHEMATYCSAQKQGKDVPLQDPQHKHTHTNVCSSLPIC